MTASTITDLLGVTSLADLLSVLTFVLAVYGVRTVRQINRKMTITHGLRTHLAVIAGIGESFKDPGMTDSAREVMVRAIVDAATKALESLDEATAALGGR